MTERAAVLLAIAVSLWLSPRSAAAEDRAGDAYNLVRNGGFEGAVAADGSVAGWPRGNLPGVEMGLSEEAAFAGQRSAYVRGTDVAAQNTNVSGWRQNIPVSGTDALVFSVRIKAEGADRIRIGVLHQPDEGANLDNQTLAVLSGTFDWQQVTGVVRPKPGTVNLNLFLGLQRSGGTVWLDDVALFRSRVPLPRGVSSLPPFRLHCEVPPRPLAGDSAPVAVRLFPWPGHSAPDGAVDLRLRCPGAAGLPEHCSVQPGVDADAVFATVFPVGQASFVEIQAPWHEPSAWWLSPPVLPRQADQPDIVFGDLLAVPEDGEAESDRLTALVVRGGIRRAVLSVPRDAVLIEAGAMACPRHVPSMVWPLLIDGPGYVTTGDRSIVLLDAGGALPGTVRQTVTDGDTVPVRWMVAAAARVRRVELFQDENMVRCWETDHLQVGGEYGVQRPVAGEQTVLILRARLAHGGMAWTAPVVVQAE